MAAADERRTRQEEEWNRDATSDELEPPSPEQVPFLPGRFPFEPRPQPQVNGEASDSPPPQRPARGDRPYPLRRMEPMQIAEPEEEHHPCLESMDSCLIAFLKFTKKRSFVLSIHFLISVLVLVLFSTSLSSPEWRFMQVNREVLILLEKEGKINGRLLLKDIAFSRTEGIYSVCFRSDPKLNVLDLPKDGCRLIMDGLSLYPNNQRFRHMMELYSAMMFMCPLFMFASTGLVFIMFFYVIAASEPCRLTLKIFTFAIRLLNVFITIVFLICFLELDKQYEVDNPSFPTPWPKVIRQVTEVHIWRRGTIGFITGMVFQVVALAFDVKESKFGWYQFNHRFDVN